MSTFGQHQDRKPETDAPSLLRYFAAILLAALGLRVAAEFLRELIQPDPEASGWMMTMMFFVFGAIPLVCAYGLLRRHLHAPPRVCPQCGGGERRPAVKLKFTHNQFLWLVGGWLFAAFWNARRDQEFVCAQCGASYAASTRGTRTAGIIAWMLLTLAAFDLVLLQLER